MSQLWECKTFIFKPGFFFLFFFFQLHWPAQPIEEQPAYWDFFMWFWQEHFVKNRPQLWLSNPKKTLFNFKCVSAKHDQTQQATIIYCVTRMLNYCYASRKSLLFLSKRKKKYEKYESDIKQMLDWSCQSCLSTQVLMCYNYPFWQLIFRILDPT